MVVVLLFFSILMATAQPGLSEATPLTCSPDFPCPDEIHARVQFWASIYKDYSRENAVFHDSRMPSRVYSSITSSEGCYKRGGKKEDSDIEAERSRIKSLLLGIAYKLENAKNLETSEEKQIFAQFPGAKAQDFRDAADNVRCQSGNRDMFEEGLARYEKYKDVVQKALKQENLNPDIEFLPFVESSYNPKALSRVGAAGMWQIMPSTARKLGLTVNSAIDERFDPELASKAAAKYLRQSYEILENAVLTLPWRDKRSALGPFVITSYNYGVVGARRMINEVGLDFPRVLTDYSSQSAKVAVQNFYASFLAARDVAKKRKTFFPNVKPEIAQPSQRITIPSPILATKLAQKLGITTDELAEYNLALTDRIWRGEKAIPQGYALRLPMKSDQWNQSLARWISDPVLKAAEEQEEVYKVRRGDTACRIAKRFQISCQTLAEKNNLGKKRIVRVGQVLRIPITVKNAVIAKVVVETEEKNAELNVIEATIAKAESDVSENRDEIVSLRPEPSSTPLVEKQDQAALDPKVPSQEAPSAFGVGLDLYVHKVSKKKRKSYQVVVLPEETLAHYADWLSTSLMKVSTSSPNRNIRSGETITLHIQNDDQMRVFEKKRIEFHRAIQEEFDERYRIVGEESHVVAKHETESKISSDYDIPEWLLRRFNPELQYRGPRTGQKLTIPTVEKK